MNADLNLLKSVAERIENDHEFMAYFLKKYSEIEHLAEPQLLERLNCSIDDYYKLALCKAPDVNSSDFVHRLNRISEYTNIDPRGLNIVIKRVNSVLVFSDTNSALFMAARDKKKKDSDH